MASPGIDEIVSGAGHEDCELLSQETVIKLVVGADGFTRLWMHGTITKGDGYQWAETKLREVITSIHQDQLHRMGFEVRIQ